MPLGAIVDLISMKIIMGSDAGFSITAHNERFSIYEEND